MAPVKNRVKRPYTGLWPPIAYGFSKAFQSFSASAVCGIMFTFIVHLNEKHYALPWMFFFLLAAALATLVMMIAMSIWSCFRPIHPLFAACISGFQFVLWTVAFALLANAMSSTITRPCTLVYWGTDRGIWVCTLYKVLFSAAGLGLLTTIACLIFDIRAVRKLSAMKARTVEGDTLLAKGVGNGQYMPVWADEQTAYHAPAGPTPAVRTG